MTASLRKLFSLLLLVPALALAQNIANDQDKNIARYLSAVRFPASFKQGIRAEIKYQGHSNDQMDRILALPDERIISAVTPVYRKLFTPEEAKAVADFYTSDTGLSIIRQQFENLDNPDPPIRLTAAQRATYKNFEQSVGGRAITRILSLKKDGSYWQQIGQAISVAADA